LTELTKRIEDAEAARVRMLDEQLRHLATWLGGFPLKGRAAEMKAWLRAEGRNMSLDVQRMRRQALREHCRRAELAGELAFYAAVEANAIDLIRLFEDDAVLLLAFLERNRIARPAVERLVVYCVELGGFARPTRLEPQQLAVYASTSGPDALSDLDLATLRDLYRGWYEAGIVKLDHMYVLRAAVPEVEAENERLLEFREHYGKETVIGLTPSEFIGYLRPRGRGLTNATADDVRGFADELIERMRPRDCAQRLRAIELWYAWSGVEATPETADRQHAIARAWAEFNRSRPNVRLS
jgi:hypothetical protein